mmetsp:Transcript_29235/g.73555  ORF Transcript_29235/g.73555 Transcript_29235/m.73555 type:complete len:236 (+) Transcript_29235:874-1581(+)
MESLRSRLRTAGSGRPSGKGLRGRRGRCSDPVTMACWSRHDEGSTLGLSVLSRLAFFSRFAFFFAISIHSLYFSVRGFSRGKQLSGNFLLSECSSFSCAAKSFRSGAMRQMMSKYTATSADARPLFLRAFLRSRLTGSNAGRFQPWSLSPPNSFLNMSRDSPFGGARRRGDGVRGKKQRRFRTPWEAPVVSKSVWMCGGGCTCACVYVGVCVLTRGRFVQKWRACLCSPPSTRAG